MRRRLWRGVDPVGPSWFGNLDQESQVRKQESMEFCLEKETTDQSSTRVEGVLTALGVAHDLGVRVDLRAIPLWGGLIFRTRHM